MTRRVAVSEVEATIILPTGEEGEKVILKKGQKVVALGVSDARRSIYWIVLVDGVLMKMRTEKLDESSPKYKVDKTLEYYSDIDVRQFFSKTKKEEENE